MPKIFTRLKVNHCYSLKVGNSVIKFCVQGERNSTRNQEFEPTPNLWMDSDTYSYFVIFPNIENKYMDKGMYLWSSYDPMYDLSDVVEMGEEESNEFKLSLKHFRNK